MQDEFFNTGSVMRLGDVSITAHDCPDCLIVEDFECQDCEYASPDDCMFLRDPMLHHNVKVLMSMDRLRSGLSRKRRARLISAIREELRDHGLPLHYSVITKMVAERHGLNDLSPKVVLMVLHWHDGEFVMHRPGVYFLADQR